MAVVSHTLNLDLGSRSYPIYIGQGLLKAPNLLLPHIHANRSVVVSNETVAPLYLQTIHATLSHQKNLKNHDVILPDGEQYKTLTTTNQIFTSLLQQRCDRTTTVIALGGGVVGDITGFAAASYQRGVNFIQIPTTLLAMVDSSVGGKTGVNHSLGKNMIGAFYQPQCVIIDIDVLATLDDRQFSAGIAEIIKYGLICDADFFTWLEQNMTALLQRDATVVSEAIYRSCQHKADIVAADEKEAGQRALLNLGHTFAHAIENGMGYGKWLHGEAVATGMVMAAELSQQMNYLNTAEVNRIRALLTRAHLPINAPKEMNAEKFLDLMAVDKKVQQGVLRLVLMKAWCESIVSSDFDQHALKRIL